VCVLGVSAQQHNIDTQKSTLVIHVGKTGVFSGLGHEHEVRAPIHSGTADTGAHPAVEIHVDARALRVIGKDEPEKDRAEVQKTMLGPEVLDSEGHQEIVFKSTTAEPAGRINPEAALRRVASEPQPAPFNGLRSKKKSSRWQRVSSRLFLL
jgi:hypothetical protein